jgi:DNA-binding MarR family transcriptional regulator
LNPCQLRGLTKDEIDRIVDEWRQERPDLDTSPTQVLQRITRLNLLQEASFAQVFGRHGLSWGEYLVLAALRRSGPPYQMNPTALYGSVILSSGGMTKRLDGLEAAGLIERRSDPADRRGRLVALTPKGKQTVDRAVLDHLANQERLLAALSSAERRKLGDLLRKLLTSEPFLALDPLPLPARSVGGPKR